MKKITVLFVALAFFCTGCIKYIIKDIPYDVKRTRGDYGGNAVYDLKNNKLLSVAEKECWSPFCISGFQFNMRKYIVDNKVRLFVVMDYSPSDASYMQNTDSLTIFAGGRRMVFKGSKKEAGAGGGAGAGANETMQSYYDITSEQAGQIGISKEVRLTIENKYYDTDLYFSKMNIDNVRSFYLGYLPVKY